MVPDPGAPARARALRSLNTPRPIRVETRPGQDGKPEPRVLVERRGRMSVERTVDSWLVEDEWWRDVPVVRRYHRVVLANGTQRTLYQDLVTGDWFAQEG